MGGILWEGFFERNYLVEINKELMFLSRFWGNARRRKDKKFRSLEVRGKLIALKNDCLEIKNAALESILQQIPCLRKLCMAWRFPMTAFGTSYTKKLELNAQGINFVLWSF